MEGGPGGGRGGPLPPGGGRGGIFFIIGGGGALVAIGALGALLTGAGDEAKTSISTMRGEGGG